MTQMQRRLKNLEEVLTDAMEMVPHSKKWLKYWDRQFYLYMTGQDLMAIWHSSIAAYRAVMRSAAEPGSLVGSVRKSAQGGARENGSRTAPAP
jgi:hypothetical protein